MLLWPRMQPSSIQGRNHGAADTFSHTRHTNGTPRRECGTCHLILSRSVYRRRDLTELLAGSVEHVTFHSEETGFCVLRVKVRGHRDLVTVVGTAPTISPGEYIESAGWWVTDRTHGLQFKTMHLRVVPPARWRVS